MRVPGARRARGRATATIVVDLGGPKQRLVLAVLLLADGRPVSIDRLIDALWADEPPARAEASLQAYVSNLRKLLEPGRRPREEPTVLVTRAGRVRARRRPRADVDAARVRGSRGRGRRSSVDAATRPRPRSCWAAPSRCGRRCCRSSPTSRRSAPRSSASSRDACSRSRAGSRRASTSASRRRSSPSCAPRSPSSPFHEPFWAQLALALYRAGQQTDALRALQDARRVLADEVGIEPGPELRRTRDRHPRPVARPDLGGAAGHRRRGSRPPAPRTGTAGPAGTGRGSSAANASSTHWSPRRVAPTAGEGSAVVISGEPGIGKTRLTEELVDVGPRPRPGRRVGSLPRERGAGVLLADEPGGRPARRAGGDPALGRSSCGGSTPATPEVAVDRLELQRQVVESLRARDAARAWW